MPITRTPVAADLAEARLDEVRRLLEGLEAPELRAALARLERLSSEVARIERSLGTRRW